MLDFCILSLIMFMVLLQQQLNCGDSAHQSLVNTLTMGRVGLPGCCAGALPALCYLLVDWLVRTWERQWK